MKKKIVSVALAVCLVAIAVTGISLAYFTDKDEKVNTFTVGNVKIELVEPNWVEPATVVPGVAYAKDPTVNNIGANDAWIRVNVTLSDAEVFKAAAANHQITDLATIFAGHDETKWTLAGVSEDEENDTITYSYYFNTIVAPEGTTGALFTSVTVPGVFTRAEMSDLGDDFTITITADAIQAQNFATAVAAFAAFDAQA